LPTQIAINLVPRPLASTQWIKTMANTMPKTTTKQGQPTTVKTTTNNDKTTTKQGQTTTVNTMGKSMAGQWVEASGRGTRLMMI